MRLATSIIPNLNSFQSSIKLSFDFVFALFVLFVHRNKILFSHKLEYWIGRFIWIYEPLNMNCFFFFLFAFKGFNPRKSNERKKERKKKNYQTQPVSQWPSDIFRLILSMKLRRLMTVRQPNQYKQHKKQKQQQQLPQIIKATDETTAVSATKTKYQQFNAHIERHQD